MTSVLVLESALLTVTLGILSGKLFSMIEEGMKLRKELKDDLQYIKDEMDTLEAAIRNHDGSEGAKPEWLGEIQELAYDIEDCIDLYTTRVTCDQQARWLLRKFHQTKTVGRRTKFAEELKKLKERARQAYERRTIYKEKGHGDAVLEPGPSTSTPYTREADLVGLETPKEELLELLKPSEPKQLRVVCVLGFGGLGKTALVRAVFDSLGVGDKDNFCCRAWVVASEHRDAKGLLGEILQQVVVGKPTKQGEATSSNILREHLQAQDRYLIVIDDLKTRRWRWENILTAFPDTHGRIIVTTSVQSIAKTCSSNGGYVYRMRTLNTEQSKRLLSKLLSKFQTVSSPDLEQGSKCILDKCDGFPLALVSIADFLSLKSDQPTRFDCKNVCDNLGSYLESNTSFATMKQMLNHSYDNLPSHDIKNCLLYVSIYPSSHRIKRENLVRRWFAEGFVHEDGRRTAEDVANDYFEELIDYSIIQPMDISNKARMKTCQLRGIMFDFIVQKSICANFITLIDNNKVRRCSYNGFFVRRLSLHKPIEESASEEMNIDLSRIRSLTILEYVDHDLVDFDKCKLVRVLDLENCKRIKDEDLDSICKMLQLKYLSLRGTNVRELPKKISKLHHLDTLDIRNSEVSILPMEVLNLPQLTHLFGKFKLPCQLNKVGSSRKMQTFFSKKSKLQTLSGFVMNNENQGFPHIMSCRLRKLKIWAESESAPNDDLTDLLVSSLKKWFATGNVLKSLSIRFGNRCIDFLDSIDGVYSLINSIKLEGKLKKLPRFITSANQLSALHLLSTDLVIQELSNLQNLPLLLYLKLVEHRTEFDEGSSFNIQSNGFQSLRRLCFQALKLPQISIEEGAMPCLSSLQLIWKDVDGPCAAAIDNLQRLKEVTLASTVSEQTKQAWEQKAKEHRNRPTTYYVVSNYPCS